MRIEAFNPYVIKILISARKHDSIIGISKRIGLSYGWAYKWISELIGEGIFKERWRGLILQEKNKSYRNIIKFLKENSSSVNFYYSVLNLFGIKYCFTKTDAVFFWVKGGYNVARYRDFYPIFVKIKESDYDDFLYYCKKLGLRINAKTGVFYSPEISKDFKCQVEGNLPVDSLEETIKFMKKNIYNFQPALEMIEEMYNKKLRINYKELKTI